MGFNAIGGINVAPHMINAINNNLVVVAPHRGAWIEGVDPETYQFKGGRPSRRGVD